jgi:hypothetical protein
MSIIKDLTVDFYPKHLLNSNYKNLRMQTLMILINLFNNGYIQSIDIVENVLALVCDPEEEI